MTRKKTHHLGTKGKGGEYPGTTSVRGSVYNVNAMDLPVVLESNDGDSLIARSFTRATRLE